MASTFNYFPNISINHNRPVLDLFHSERLAKVDGGINRLWVFVGHLHKRQFDDGRGVAPDAEVPIQNLTVLVAVHEIEVTLCSLVPAFVLYKGVVGTEIDLHGAAADGTMGNQFGRDFHIVLRRNHSPDGFLIVVGFLVTRFRTLEQPVVALGIEQPLFVEASLLKLVVDIGDFYS